MMTPIMIAATAYKSYGLLKHRGDVGDAWGSMLLATIVAGVVGYLVIGFLLNWLRSRSLLFFVVWRLAVGALCIGMFVMQRSTAPAGRPARVPASGVRHSIASPVRSVPSDRRATTLYSHGRGPRPQIFLAI
jgi:hypothetical protein